MRLYNKLLELSCKLSASIRAAEAVGDSELVQALTAQKAGVEAQMDAIPVGPDRDGITFNESKELELWHCGGISAKLSAGPAENEMTYTLMPIT